MAFTGKVHRDKKSMPSKSGTVPKSQTTTDTPSTAGASAFRTSHNGNTALSFWPEACRTPTPLRAALQLQKETQELEIKKLEQQLQFCQLQGTQIASPNSTKLSPSKSLSNLKEPQTSLQAQPWPHIFALGEPKMYNELSMLSFAWVIQSCTAKGHQTPFRRSSRTSPPTHDPGINLLVVSCQFITLQSFSFPQVWFG